MPRPLYIVDAFADKPFAGNPAAVVLLEPDDGPASDDYLQNVAAEMNLSETAFVGFDESTGPNRFGLRWFTPVREVDLCGHATLAAAQTLYDAAKVDLHTPILFDTRSGVLRAAPAPDFCIGEGRAGGFTLDFPATPPKESEPPAGLIDVLGLGRPRASSSGRSAFDWFLVVRDADRRARASRPTSTIWAAIGGRGTIVDQPRPTRTTPASTSSAAASTRPTASTRIPSPAAPTARSARTSRASPGQGHAAAAARPAAAAASMGVRVEADRVYLTGQARAVVRGELLV